MLRAYKYRIYPTEEQKVMFAKTFGCVRFVYNWALETRKKAWDEERRFVSCFELMNMLTPLKKELQWLKEPNSQALTASIRCMDTAYTNFFKHGKKFPKFKGKNDVQKFHNPQKCFVDFERGCLSIPKIKDIKAVFHRTFSGEIRNVFISKNKDERYYACILVLTNDITQPKQEVERETSIGIDMGIKTFAVCSDGQSFSSPYFQRKQKHKLKILGRKLSKKQKGSCAFNKIKLRIARVHSKISRQKMDYHHKITYKLTHENQVKTIFVENLNVKGMLRNKHISFVVSEASIYEFYRQLKYKSSWYGINYIEIGRFEPTSKTCSTCGWVYKNLKLRERKWICPKCGATHDRDFNAAINIKEFGLKALRMGHAKVKPVERPLVDDRPSGPKKQRCEETGICKE